MLPARSPQKIYLYQFLTLGFYFYYWCQRTGREVNQLAHRQVVPSAWWFLIPGFGTYWWMWNYSEALHNLSQRRIKKSDTFLLYILVTFLYGTPFSFTNFFHSDSTTTSSDVKTFLILIAIVFCIVYVIELIAIGFFCATMQKKLNTVFSTPAVPAVPTAPQPPVVNLQPPLPPPPAPQPPIPPAPPIA